MASLISEVADSAIRFYQTWAIELKILSATSKSPFCISLSNL